MIIRGTTGAFNWRLAWGVFSQNVVTATLGTFETFRFTLIMNMVQTLTFKTTPRLNTITFQSEKLITEFDAMCDVKMQVFLCLKKCV